MEELGSERKSVLISCYLKLFNAGNESDTGSDHLKRKHGESTLGGKVAAWAKTEAQMGKVGGGP